MSEMRFGRHFYTDAELLLKTVPCPCCGGRAQRGATIGSMIQDFECFECGATWRGDRRNGRVLAFHHDFCVQHDQVQEVA